MAILKKPQKCRSIDEIRNEIDRIDKKIISLFSLRNDYVKEIVHYKNDEEGIIALVRRRQVIEQISKLAEEQGLNSRLFARIYNDLIEENIKNELEIFKNKINT